MYYMYNVKVENKKSIKKKSVIKSKVCLLQAKVMLPDFGYPV